MGAYHGYSVTILSSLCVASILIVLLLSRPFFCTLMRFSGSKPEFSVPMVELQKMIASDDQVRAVRTGGSGTGFFVNRFGTRTLVVRSISLSLSLYIYIYMCVYVCTDFRMKKRNRPTLYILKMFFNHSQFVLKFLYILIYRGRERETIFACCA
jgi:hypothetical protein